ncbi:platelet-activating factor acetylhydrolase, plasma/intracellular isoform II family protein [Asticcacaulis biprosthecium C19]|uniref:Platelet-activating factor acetylhydrolase, plasma/intracellular isoform II family protein n=1 Tax=Asticcacaulis biprosthecium C19 TaxID=715226 RepID=F4QT75_9CAUL|nr:platelet-activating factor acetylhydrolase, plasma/intracellular isoform II family protein [Asticcacaulis biprosthecium C19]
MLLFLLSLPFYVLGAAGDRLPIASFLPLTALMAFMPVIAALILVVRDSGLAGARALFARVLDYDRINSVQWLLVALLIMPVVFLLHYGVYRLSGAALPDAQLFSILEILAFALMFLVGAVGEELGWQGYAFAGLSARWSALTTSLILGTVWALWHVIPYAQMGHDVGWIAWQCLATIALRVIIVWLFANTGHSVFIAVLFHATINIPWGILTNYDAYYAPFLLFVILAVVAVIVVVLAGAATLRASDRCDHSGSKGSARYLAAGGAVGSGALILAAAIAFRIVLPVFHFPRPTGPYAIGTVTYHWVDANRPDIFRADPAARREVMVQVWYPAQAVPAAPRAPYLADADAVTAAFARLQRKPQFLFSPLKYVTTDAVSSAPIANDQRNYPVLIFLEGATGFRQMNTYQIEELVSHGYIVAAIDQPGAAANVVFPDGRQQAGLTVAQLHAMVGSSYMRDRVAPRLNGHVLEGNSIIPYLAQDVSFTLDQLAEVNRADAGGILTGKLDMQGTGVFGISLGGIVAGDSCLRDPRLKACLVMDAAMSLDVVKSGLRQPAMWITRDATDMRLERQRSGGWPEPEIESHQTSMRSVYESLARSGYFVRVSGMFHSNFTDISNWSPVLSQIGVTGPIDAVRAHTIVNAYSRAFFDRHLKGRPAPLLAGPSDAYPEVKVETKP